MVKDLAEVTRQDIKELFVDSSVRNDDDLTSWAIEFAANLIAIPHDRRLFSHPVQESILIRSMMLNRLAITLHHIQSAP